MWRFCRKPPACQFCENPLPARPVPAPATVRAPIRSRLLACRRRRRRCPAPHAIEIESLGSEGGAQWSRWRGGVYRGGVPGSSGGAWAVYRRRACGDWCDGGILRRRAGLQHRRGGERRHSTCGVARGSAGQAASRGGGVLRGDPARRPASTQAARCGRRHGRGASCWPSNAASATSSKRAWSTPMTLPALLTPGSRCTPGPTASASSRPHRRLRALPPPHPHRPRLPPQPRPPTTGFMEARIETELELGGRRCPVSGGVDPAGFGHDGRRFIQPPSTNSIWVPWVLLSSLSANATSDSRRSLLQPAFFSPCRFFFLLCWPAQPAFPRFSPSSNAFQHRQLQRVCMQHLCLKINHSWFFYSVLVYMSIPFTGYIWTNCYVL